MTFNFVIRLASMFFISVILMLAVKLTWADWRYWTILVLVTVYGIAQWEAGRKGA